MIGQTLGHYRILEQIGAGGMGVVYRAHDERLDRDVALKVLPAGTLADEAARKRFRKEALTLSKLNHPNIGTVFDFDTQEGVDFLVMELIPGIMPDQRSASGPMPEKEVLHLGQQLAEGLAAAHEQSVIHRDLKPGNLRVTPDGRLKILDFGLAKLLQPAAETDLTASVTETQAVTGTLPYMAPEQLRGEAADARSDIWAAGAVLYELATGRRPFDAKVSTALAGDIQHKPPSSPRQVRPELSSRLEDVILKCLEKDAGDRYQSARELAVDLRRLAAPVSAVVAVAAPTKRSWKIATAISLGLLVVLITAVAVLNPAGLRDRLLGRATTPQIKSIAVLPLANLSGDPGQDYFADGMTEALIADLAQINALKVISRTSVMQYKDTRKPLPQIGRELGVEAVIEGSVLKVGNRVRITAQLIESATDRHLWAQSYDRDVRDVLVLQDQVARAIADQVQAELTPQEQSRLTSARQVNPEAHELYLKGRYQANKVSVESLGKAVEYFQKAVELDPNDALVCASLADAYGTLGVFGGLPPKEAFPKAKPLVAKALALDDKLALAHQVLASIKRDYEWDWEGAEKEFRRALELNPNSADARDMYAVHLVFMRRFEEALREIQHAQSLDPLNLDASNNLGFIAFALHDNDRAIEAYRRTIDLDSSFVMSHRELGLVYSSRGLHPQAISESEKAVALSRDPYTLAMLGHVYASAGRRQEALRILEELKKRSKHEFVSAYYFADLYAGLHEKELTLQWLEKAYEERDTALLWTGVDPRFDWLRSDARFQDLMRRMNLPQ